ncbi:MAG: hypothetical protein AMJ81_02365 [Phycisphaerae bacterium SM23_33]|nr:MAG: hypothetical protein AMJ81_02365 [Phycisphaerae bacterium SM23_33]
MPEEIVWNKKLLVVSLILGVVAAGLFYAYSVRMQKKLTGDTVRVLAWKRDLGAGSLIAMKDIEFPTVRRRLAETIDGILLDREDDIRLLKGQAYVSRNVYKGDFVRFNDIIGPSGQSPSAAINEGMRAVTLRVDPNTTPGDMLRVNDRVDVIGLVNVGAKGAKAYTILENVRVLAVGGQSEPPSEQWSKDITGRRYQPSLRAYRSVTVEVTRETAESLSELEPRILGNIRIALRRPPRGTEAGVSGTLNPELQAILKQPLPQDVGS